MSNDIVRFGTNRSGWASQILSWGWQCQQFQVRSPVASERQDHRRERQKKPPWLPFPEQTGMFASGVSRAVSTKPIRTWLAGKSLSALHWSPVSWGPRVHILWNLLGSLNILCFGSTRYCLPAESVQRSASRPHPSQDGTNLPWCPCPPLPGPSQWQSHQGRYRNWI